MVAQSSFEGWAIVEMIGRRREIGYVTTQAFGQAIMFRMDVPALPEREYVPKSPQSARVNGDAAQWCPKGSKVKRSASPGRSPLIAPQSLYAINPCSEEAAIAALERSIERPLMLMELPAGYALPSPQDSDDPADEDEDSRWP
jgi:hypothetical protein